MNGEGIPNRIGRSPSRLVPWTILVVICLAGCSPEGAAEGNSALGGGPLADAATPSVKSKPVSDGPFGIDFGVAANTVPGAKPMETPGLYETTKPPKSHSDFESVVLAAYPETGICTIRGIGRDIQNDGAGLSIRSQIDSLADALQTKYGVGEKNDSCVGSEISCQGQFWMMTLNDGERFYGYSWEAPNAVMKRNKIQSIYLAARASDINTSYSILEFHSSNQAACEAAKKKLSASAL